MGTGQGLFGRGTGDETLAAAEAYDVLQNDRRRRVLERLGEEVGGARLDDLADGLATTEADESPPPDGLRESVYNSLHQTHLPKLEGLGLVTYDRERKTVSLRPQARHLARYRRPEGPFGLSWGEWYRGVALVGFWASLVVHLDWPPFSGLDPLVVTSLALGVLTLSSLYQVWTRRRLYLHLLVYGE